MTQVTLISNPLIQDKLTDLRSKDTPVDGFRNLAADISMLMAYEASKHLPTMPQQIQTPVADHTGLKISGGLVLISIMRAGDGMLSGMLRAMPKAKVGHIGLYRDEEKLEPVSYYKKLPEIEKSDHVFLLDPMLATGNSAVAALDMLPEKTHVTVMCLIASQKGIDRLKSAYPNFNIITCAIDPILNEKGYIVPGLGDAGDRIFGTL